MVLIQFVIDRKFLECKCLPYQTKWYYFEIEIFGASVKLLSVQSKKNLSTTGVLILFSALLVTRYGGEKVPHNLIKRWRV